jgi:O-succinylbenzoic acid--CoA ligase
MQNNIMPNFLKKRAFLTPDRIAIYFQEEAVTFKQLYDYAVKTAGQLQTFGLAKGDFAGVLLTNHIETAIILFAFQLLGVRAVILNNRLSPAELQWQLTDSKAVCLILESAFLEKVPSIRSITKEELFAATVEEPIIEEEIDLTEICTIMYTSGTTGNPKGVIQTYGNHWWSAVGSALNLGYTEGDCWLCNVPLFHISGFSILMKSVIYGMPIVLHEKFDPQKTIKDIQSKQVTIMSVVGTTLSRIVDVLGADCLPAYFRCMLLGGGPAPLPLLQACVEKEIPVFQTYGMTETSSQIVTLSPEYSLSKLGSAGKPLFPSQLRIEREGGSIAGAKDEGGMVVRGPRVTSGAVCRPEATNKTIQEGWLYTGDIGYLDEEGFLYVLDRRADLIISGGENIYPAEIEAILLGHPCVAEAGVTGMEDAIWGQVPIAFVVRKSRSPECSEDELRRFCMEQIAKYKVPKRVYFVETLPRNAAKKLLRRKLSDLIGEGREE